MCHLNKCYDFDYDIYYFYIELIFDDFVIILINTGFFDNQI